MFKISFFIFIDLWLCLLYWIVIVFIILDCVCVYYIGLWLCLLYWIVIVFIILGCDCVYYIGLWLCLLYWIVIVFIILDGDCVYCLIMCSKLDFIFIVLVSIVIFYNFDCCMLDSVWFQTGFICKASQPLD